MSSYPFFKSYLGWCRIKKQLIKVIFRLSTRTVDLWWVERWDYWSFNYYSEFIDRFQSFNCTTVWLLCVSSRTGSVYTDKYLLVLLLLRSAVWLLSTSYGRPRKERSQETFECFWCRCSFGVWREDGDERDGQVTHDRLFHRGLQTLRSFYTTCVHIHREREKERKHTTSRDSCSCLWRSETI